ncbi:MAG: response regulator [bacterium JZ-2024 1]
MPKILVVDDDRNATTLLEKFLGSKGYEVVTASNGKQGYEVFLKEKPDLVLVDVMMPQMDGWMLGKKIREISNVGLIYVTVRGSVDDKLRGFTLGADDYVTKPFDLKELQARIEAVLKRKPEKVVTELTAGPVKLDLARKEAFVNGTPVHLSPMEFSLLTLLIQKKNQAVSIREIVQFAWGAGSMATSDDVKKYIWMLRKKIEPNPAHPTRILTVRGFGYRFDG